MHLVITADLGPTGEEGESAIHPKYKTPIGERCDVFFTMWGDNGGECSKFALLPSLFYASEIAKGNTNKIDIKVKFREKYGVDFDRFMLLDLTGTPGGSDKMCNADKYLLYNDCFMGL